jgi:hypothetical protein
MRTAIVDDILRRIEGRPPTREEIRLRQERLRLAAQLVCEIAEPSGRRPRRPAARQFG